MSINTGFLNETSSDLGQELIDKDEATRLYPNIMHRLKAKRVLITGSNAFGGLGLGLNPTQLASISGSWAILNDRITAMFKAIDLGYAYGLAIREEGTLWGWGKNDVYQLGLGGRISTPRSTPVQIGTGTDWASIAAGYNFSYGIKTDGTLWGWGDNSAGGKGFAQQSSIDPFNNTVYYYDTIDAPTQIGTATWKKIISLEDNAVGIQTNGSLWVVGDNSHGQTGNNFTSGHSLLNDTFTQMGTLTTWVDIAGGFGSIVAKRSDGTLWAWGFNNYGQLGQNNRIDRSSPVQILAGTTNWDSLGMRSNTVFAIKTNGTLWAWGRNDAGQLGDNTVINRSSPVQIGAGTDWIKATVRQNGGMFLKSYGRIFITGNPYSSPVQNPGYRWVDIFSGVNVLSGIIDESLD